MNPSIERAPTFDAAQQTYPPSVGGANMLLLVDKAPLVRINDATV